ncbi:hypothetical protein [Ammonifex thiophilus]|uniref:Outer membrane lipoprotein carrier protein LolA n=1 Tax=Ammonifex thiophilus TaxID=444093 RepID=A0A3D8P6W0_9THEO|nr:hypothetical protein [Ammonifex thiophilus]RDV83968.1 hypothetical protein DXX99_03805 [Ammonifex thiophilus]
MRWFFWQRKRLILVISLVLVLLVLVGLLVNRLGEGRGKLRLPPPADLLQQALERTRQAPSYSYSLSTKLLTPQGTRLLSELQGLRTLPDCVYVRGKLFNAPVEIIRVGETAYIKDPFSPKWLAFPGERLGETRVFTAELDPLVLLDFASPPTARWARAGPEEKGLWVLECPHAVPRHPELATQFTDFRYRIGVDPSTRYITRVEVEAKGKKAPTQLKVGLKLGDFGHKKKIEPPPHIFTPKGG